MKSYVSDETTRVVEAVTRERLVRNRMSRPLTESAVCDAVSEIFERLDRIESERADGRRPREEFSLVKAIRGMAVRAHRPIVPETATEDEAYLERSTSTGVAPGAYLVPTLQANRIVQQLSLGSAARASGATIWDMQGVQDMNVPIGITTPSFQWMAQNSRQTPTDFSMGQMSFDLKECWAFELLPIQLFRSALPKFSDLLEMFFAIGLGEAEDNAIFSAATLASAPPALLSSSGIVTMNTGSNPNGTNLVWQDVVNMLEKSATSKVKPPLGWFMHPRTLTRLLNLVDSSSRPLLIPTISGNGLQSNYELMGWPIWLSVGIPITQALGSGSNQSSIVLAPPRNFHIAQDEGIQMAISMEFALESAQVALRVGARRSLDYQPRGAFVCLLGIN
jgi:HK97 family phage major capsid protein